MPKVTRYMVGYAGISSVISKQQIDSDEIQCYSDSSICAETWEQAHAFLLMHAMRRMVKANEQSSAALNYLNEVLNMHKP